MIHHFGAKMLAVGGGGAVGGVEMILSRRSVIVAAAGSALSACETMRGPNLGTSRTVSFESLVRQIKYDVGTFMVRHAHELPVVSAADQKASLKKRRAYEADMRRRGARTASAREKCLGQVSFSIQSVHMEVTTTTDNMTGGNVGLKVPLDLVTISPTLSASSIKHDSLTTALDIYPEEAIPTGDLHPPAGWSGTPIADTLDALSVDLIRTADTLPCFDFGRGEGKTGTVKWGFTVTDKYTGGLGISVALFSLGANLERTRLAANTIEVAFMGVGGFD